MALESPTSDVAGHGATEVESSTHHAHRGRTLLRAVVLAAVMAALGYAGGRLQSWQEVRDTQAQLRDATDQHTRALTEARQQQQDALARAQRELTEARTRADALAQLATLYEGLRQTQHALTALDARNFGTAQEDLDAAASTLTSLSAAIAGLEDPIHRLEATKLAVTGNLGEQRDRIAAIASDLDALASRERTARADSLSAR